MEKQTNKKECWMLTTLGKDIRNWALALGLQGVSCRPEASHFTSLDLSLLMGQVDVKILTNEIMKHKS